MLAALLYSWPIPTKVHRVDFFEQGVPLAEDGFFLAIPDGKGSLQMN